MRVALFGDSLLRQVFLAAACGAWDSVVRSEVGWPRCRGASRRRGGWPCRGGGEDDCVACGPGSGFHSAIVAFADGLVVEFHASAEAEGVRRDELVARFEKYDAVVLEAGVKGMPHDAIGDRLGLAQALLRAPRAPRHVLWMETPAQHFGVSHSADGSYNASAAAAAAATGEDCVATVLSQRAEIEWAALRAASPPLLPRAFAGNDAAGIASSTQSPALCGVLSLAGMETLGAAKVGGGDCTHFCMPSGVTGALATALLALLEACASG